MSNTLTTYEPVIAGLVRASCTCCAEPQRLQGHPDLDASHLFCPSTSLTYLDRGDGLFEADGGTLSRSATPASGIASKTAPVVDVLGDRPRRTADKVRIELERATFA
jgi:hypothetical protein